MAPERPRWEAAIASAWRAEATALGLGPVAVFLRWAARADALGARVVAREGEDDDGAPERC